MYYKSAIQFCTKFFKLYRNSEMLTDTINFIKRHLTWFLIGVAACLGFVFIPGIPATVQVILYMPALTAEIIFLSSVVTYTFSPDNFNTITANPLTQSVAYAIEYLGNCIVKGLIVLSMALVTVGLNIGFLS